MTVALFHGSMSRSRAATTSAPAKFAIRPCGGNGKRATPSATSKMWEYIRSHDLQNPDNRREILADDKLRRIFGKEKVTMFEMNKHLAGHLKWERRQRIRVFLVLRSLLELGGQAEPMMRETHIVARGFLSISPAAPPEVVDGLIARGISSIFHGRAARRSVLNLFVSVMIAAENGPYRSPALFLRFTAIRRKWDREFESAFLQWWVCKLSVP
jgi:hypothetical protein